MNLFHFTYLYKFIPTFWAVQIAPPTRWMVGAQKSWRLMFWEDEKIGYLK
jgi:hypothetical protein